MISKTVIHKMGSLKKIYDAALRLYINFDQ